MELVDPMLVTDGVLRLAWLSWARKRMSVSDVLVILDSPAVVNMTKMLSLVEVMTLPRWKWLHSSRKAMTSDCW